MIGKEDVDYLKGLFVTWESCNSTVATQKDELAAVKVDTGIIKARLNMLLAILGAIGVAVLSIAIKLLFGGAI